MNADVACIGAGYIGGPTMAVLAQQNPDRTFYVVDRSQARIDAWNSAELPIFEPGLQEIVAQCRGRNLFFSTDIAGAIKRCDTLFVCVNTPTKTSGEGAGYASDLSFWEAAAKTIAREANSDKIVVEKSTLPVKTADAMEAILRSHPEHRFTVLSNPEFLAEGTAINDLLTPDRVLIGGPQTPEGKEAMAQLAALYRPWIVEENIIMTNLWSAEMSKLAANAMLAQRLSSVNAFSALCEVTGADIDEVSDVLGMDHRIGAYFLKAGPGFGGSCFKKDLLSLIYLCRSYGLDVEAEYWEMVLKINVTQQERIIRRLLEALGNDLASKRVALFGIAFKANTGDTRESPAYAILPQLLNAGIQLTLTDPKALPQAQADFKTLPQLTFEEDPYRAAEDCDAIVLLTEWACYKTLDWARIKASMRPSAILYDTRNLLNHAELKKYGFKIFAVGKIR